MAEADLIELAERVLAGSGLDNALDVEIEVALFTPDLESIAVRANAAGTKVIYSNRCGTESTHWAEEWTADRPGAAAALRGRARSSQTVTSGEGVSHG